MTETELECGVATQTEIHFQNSGIKIAPVNLTYKSDTRNYDYVRAQISIEAANVINDNSHVPEQTVIYSGGRKLAVTYIPEDAVTIQQDEAHIELYDPRKFLDRGVIDKYFSKITLREIVEWFGERVKSYDNHGVISDVQLITNGKLDPDQMTEDFRKHVGWAKDIDDAIDQGKGWDDEVTNFELGIRRWLSNTFDGLEEEGGFDFDQITLAECLQQIQEEFQIGSYIDEDGVLRIGAVEADAKFFTAGNHPDAWSVSEYNVTVDPSKVSQVYVKGGYEYAFSLHVSDPSEISLDLLTEGARTTKTQTWGYATTDHNATYGNATKDVPGQAISINASEVSEGIQLEARAARRMEKEMAQEVTGNITVNCISSSPNIGYPQDVKPLDTLGILPVRGECKYDIPKTSFVIESVKHEISADEWKLQLDVSQLPQTVINTASFKTDPTDAEFMNSEKFYEDTGSYQAGSAVSQLQQ